MLKRVLSGCLAVVLLVMNLGTAVLATEEKVTSGSCGEGITWSYDSNVLTISGEGEMEDGDPWYQWKDRIEKVVFTGGVTKVGSKAFYDYDRLETIDLGDSMVEIGAKAFMDCNDIVEVRTPKGFKIFGPECFRGCQSLKRVICEGGMPSFKDSCLYTGNYISVFFPPNNPWPSSSVNQLMTGFGGLLGVFMASEDIMKGEHEFEAEETTGATEETEAAAETEPAQTAPAETVMVTVPPATEATVPPATQPLIILTEPTTVPTTVPETTAETTAPETTELVLFTEETEETEPLEEAVKEQRNWTPILMIAGVITFLVAGAMIFRGSRRKGW